MNILVTGGAGYIGSVCVQQLISKNHHVVVVDNLSRGKRELVSKKATFYKVSLENKKELFDVFTKHTFDTIIHFAGYKAVEESMMDAEKYSTNITGTINVLDAMVKFNIKKIIYSSSAAVYGMPATEQVNEASPTEPINYYGFTKKIGEDLISWYSKIHGIIGVSLRYFNVVGDGGLLHIDPDAKNILPLIMEVAFKKRKELTIFGTDYNTLDGTCVRDYIDVNDLVDAHIKALEINKTIAINVGSNKGYSVTELITAVEKVINEKIPVQQGQRREGDPATLTADITLAKKLLSWTPKQTLHNTINSTYKAYKQHFSDAK